MLVVDDNSARGQWPIGRIVELCPDDMGWFGASWLKRKRAVFTDQFLNYARLSP